MAEVSATVSLKYRDQATAQSILEAITPDNTEAKGISIRAHVEDTTLLITVNCTRGVRSLLSKGVARSASPPSVPKFEARRLQSGTVYPGFPDR